MHKRKSPVHRELRYSTIYSTYTYTWGQYRPYGRPTSHVIPYHKFLHKILQDYLHLNFNDRLMQNEKDVSHETS